MSQHNLVHRDNLDQSSRRFIETTTCQDDSVFSGAFHSTSLRSGLSLHYSDGYDTNTLITEVEVRERLNLILFLDGHCDVRYGDRPVRLGPQQDNAGHKQHEALLLSIAEPDVFSRCLRKGSHIRKVVIGISPEWFENGGLAGTEDYARIQAFNRQHLALERWRPSSRILALAEQIIHPPACNRLLEGLYQESRVLEIIGEALSTLAQQPAGRRPACLRPHEQRRIAKVLELLDSGAADGWSLEQIAREANVHANTLQRQFQAHQGMSLFEYQRHRKLNLAREALELRGVSIAEAAWLAGYGSAANFATAFKRQFGLTPRQVRSGV